ncbi:hypothetical protein C2S51_026128 [Perilla frutescens var. frutescens]|nr:hypothetical protein C2S51_026128 [Perilla frutescens var. frutescens]
MYAIPSVIDTIRDTLLAIGGDAVRLFRSGCFGYFLDYRGGDVQKRVIHALMAYEVHAPDRARVGREAWFHIHHSRLRFGPSEYALVSGLRFGNSTFDPHGDHIVPSRFVYHRLFEEKRCEDIVRIPEMDGKGSKQYHFYGPIWALQVWACEVIPELASEVGVHSGQLTVPRCLRWTFRLPATDPATLLQRALEPGAQSVRFVPARFGNKKKISANVVSCCSISAEEVVPPSARGTRAARTPQMGCQVTSRPSSSRALRDEPDHTESGAPPPTNDAPVHTADSIDLESPPRAWGMKRLRRDRTPSSGEPSESFIQRVVDRVMSRVQELIDTTIAPRVQEYVDRTIDRALGGLTSRARRSPTSDVRARYSPELSHHSAAHRAPTPPGMRAPQPTVVQEGTSTSAPLYGGFSMTYQLMNGIDDNSFQISYSRFRLQGPDTVVQLYFNGDHLRRPSSEHGRSFILLTPSAERHTGTMTTGGEDLQRAWYIESRAVMGGIRWHGRGAIVVCDVSDEHWVVVHIHFFDWVVELYDSLLFQMNDPSDHVEYKRRDRELMPLLRLLPRLLICAGFWEGRPMPPRCAFAMTLDKSIPDQYVQTNATSCGVYACMYVERLLGAGPPPDISEQTVHEYRKVIGARIYSLTYIQRPGV